MHARMFPVCLCAAVIAAAPALAQSDAESNDQLRIELLERQVEVLEQQIKILERSIAELRAKLAAVESSQGGAPGSESAVASARTPDVTPGRRPPNPLLTPGAVRRQPNPLLPPAPPTSADVLGETRPPDTATATVPPPGRLVPSNPSPDPAPEKPADFTSVESLLRALPADAAPDPEVGWTTARHTKAIAWLKENAAGKTYRGPVRVFGSTIAGIGSADDPDNPEARVYRFQIDVLPEKFDHLEMSHEGRFRDADGAPLIVTVLSTQVTRGRNPFQTGTVVQLEGTIQAVLLPLASSTRTIVELRLSDYEIANLRP